MKLDSVKKSQHKTFPLFLVLFLFCLFPSHIIAMEFGVGARNFGFMYEIGNKFSDNFNFRMALGGFDIEADEGINSARTPSMEDIILAESVNIESKQFSALIDYHPSEGGFRFTSGVTHSLMVFEVVNFGNRGFIIGNKIFNNRVVDSTELRVQLADGISPYFGFGWATGFSKQKGFSFNGDIGFIFSSNIEVDFIAQCSDSATKYQCKKLQSSARKERLGLEKDFQLNFLPVVGLGLSYKF